MDFPLFTSDEWVSWISIAKQLFDRLQILFDNTFENQFQSPRCAGVKLAQLIGMKCQFRLGKQQVFLFWVLLLRCTCVLGPPLLTETKQPLARLCLSDVPVLDRLVQISFSFSFQKECPSFFVI